MGIEIFWEDIELGNGTSSDELGVDNEKVIEEYINKIIPFALEYENLKKPYDVCVSFVSNDIIKHYNNEHRGIDKATDVLSFPMVEFEPVHDVNKMRYENFKFTNIHKNEIGDIILGDIVIAYDIILSQSISNKNSFLWELCLLTVHSVLHLLGYDHATLEDEKLMFTRQEDILIKAGIAK